MRAGWLLPLFLLSCVQISARAQFTFATNNDGLTITGYSGPGGTVVIPASTNGLPVTRVGNSAFDSWSTITNVSIPGSVVEIQDRAFYQCTGLTSIALPNSVTNLGTSAFYGCTSLGSVTLGNGLNQIGVWAFQECGSLMSVVVPDSVTGIGDLAFSYCGSLTNVMLGSGLASLKSQPFFLCTKLKAIGVDALNASFSSVGGVLFDKSQTTLIQFPEGMTGSYAVPSGVVTIANDAFQYCSGLTNLTLPASLTSIGSGAFYQCPALTNPVLPAALASIGDYAFQYCNRLTSMTIPGNVTNIGIGAFSSCVAMTAISVDALNSSFSSSNGVLFDKAQAVLIQFPGGKSGSYAIPDSVTSVGVYAFFGCAALSGVTFPGSVTSIGAYAFYHCQALTTVVLPNITSIAWGTFDFCTNLRKLVIPASVTNIADFALASCGNLKDVYFEGDAPFAASTLFTGDTKATAYYLPNTAGWSGTFGGRPALLWNPTVQPDGPSFGITSNRFGFIIAGTANIPLAVEGSTRLVNPAWVVLRTGTLTNGSIFFSDTGWTNYPARFYRLRSP